MTTILFIVIGFFCGSLMFSAWIARLVLRTDLAGVGDGNPGATNVIKSGGLGWGLLAMCLDISKGAAPVGLARVAFGITGWELVLVAIAPVIGHAFSPFMRFNGGKAMAVSLGIWIGLTLWEIPLVALIAVVIAYRVLDNSGWSIVATLVAMLIALLVRGDPVLIAVLLINAAIAVYKYRADLRRPPGLRARRKPTAA